MRFHLNLTSMRLHATQWLWLLAVIAIAWPVHSHIFSGFDHNENMYIAAADLLRRRAALYTDFAYLQMPLLPWVYAVQSALVNDKLSLLAIGRGVSWLSWLALTCLFTWQARRCPSPWKLVTSLAAVLILGLNSTLLRAANESSNYILPAVLLFGGTVLFQSPHRLAPLWAGLLFGLATSTKLFYLAFIPALAIAFPPARWRPLLVGLAAGLALPLYYWVSSPNLFFFQNFEYHRLTSEWRSAQRLPLGFTWEQRLDILRAWISRPDQYALMLLGVGSLVVMLRKRNSRACAYIFVVSVPLAFVLAPVFEQYLVLPVLGALVVISTALCSRAVCCGLVAASLAHVAYDYHGILRTAERPSILKEFKSVCADISRRVDPRGLTAATLSPLYALECGISVYPEFSTGPFLYRIAERIGPEQPTRQLTVSPLDLERFLDARQPDLIITGQEGKYDRRFDSYAKDHGYEQIVSRPSLRVYLLSEQRVN